jgi:integrase
MGDSNSTHDSARSKPAKPYPDFPLFAHATKRWAKKIRGKLHYFGPWHDPDGALAKYLDKKDDLHAGRTAKPDAGSLTIKDVANSFLNIKQKLVDSGELSPLTWSQYKRMADELVRHVGKNRLVADLGTDDFARLRDKLAKKWGPHLLKKAIQYIRSIFKNAFDADLIDRPIRFGPGFKRPTMKTMRLHRAKQGPKLLGAEEVRRILGVAGTQLKAMLLLGINAAFGNSDCGNLPKCALDLVAGWVTFPRPKTGINRRCWLWPETVEALKSAIAKRPEPKNPVHASLVFITKAGKPRAKDIDDSPITKETAKLLQRLDINGRKGLGFYTLRHTFRTIADESKDQPAVDFIMGHEVPHMSAVYRETISDARLKAVAEHVRKWLFGEPAAIASPMIGSEPKQ